jgi:hypothetical protein
VAVLNHNGGANNLTALKSLLDPIRDAAGHPIIGADGQVHTPLSRLMQAELTMAQIVAVLNHGGGANNVMALKSLLAPIQDAAGHPIIGADGQVQTPLSRLMQAGLTMAQIVAVLNHDGGSKNIFALLNLLTTREIFDHVHDHAEIREAVFSLAKKKSKSDHIKFLTTFLEIERFRVPLFGDHARFKLFMHGIEKNSAGNLRGLEISEATIVMLCTQGAGVKRKSRAAVEEAEERVTRPRADSPQTPVSAPFFSAVAEASSVEPIAAAMASLSPMKLQVFSRLE